MKTIPLVIHVVYATDEQNISDEQIASQIKSLNADFSRTNSDRDQTPSAFRTVAADTGIRFCHVRTIRKKTNVTLFSDNDAIKYDQTGGSDALDTTKYMNVWVCNLGERLLGYGELPNTQATNTYGVVINYGAFGSSGTARSPYDKGRTLTHELAHCLGVLHTFSESNQSSCTKTDHCPDIPSQSTPSKGCPSFPKLDNCSISSPGVMFMNYMDYTNDSCMNVFTQDQADRMNAVLSIAPYNNLSVTECTPPVPEVETPNNQIPVTMTTNNKNMILAVISIIILIIIWTRKNWSTKIKVIYTLVYAVIGGFIYYKVLYPKDMSRLTSYQ